MKRYVKDFILKGLIACGFGPIIWVIVYFFLETNGIVEVLSVKKVITDIIMVEILAFIAGGVNVVYQIERLPLMAAIFVHGIALYLDYMIIYLINGWLASGKVPFLIFTGCFFVGYAVIWAVIYFVTKRNANQMNKKLSGLQGNDE